MGASSEGPQTQMPLHRIEVAIRVEQGVAVLYAECGDQHIDTFLRTVTPPARNAR